jgi:hypothetical protein
MVMCKLSFRERMTIEEVSTTINDFEAKLRKERPESRWCFIEPDVPRA